MASHLRTFQLLLAAFCLSPVAVHAQSAVTTIGATDARQCFENAANDFSSDTRPCDSAIRHGNTTRKDRRKTFVNRGVIHNRNGAIEEAIEDFNAALDEDPDLAEAYLNRGNSWFLAGRLDAALADYEASLARETSKPWVAWYNIGLVHDARKEKDKARAAYENAMKENPNFSMAQKKLAEQE